MANRETAFIEITPEVLLKAYACGIFPMADSADDPALYWIEPEKRGIIPLETFHIPGRLARTVRSDRFSIAVNHDFEAVLDEIPNILTWLLNSDEGQAAAAHAQLAATQVIRERYGTSRRWSELFHFG
jgi:Leu/Phe-tRNA-protein transferase